MIKCPKCQNDNQSMLETTSHRREQVNVHCDVCSYDWVHEFKEVPKEELVKKPKFVKDTDS